MGNVLSDPLVVVVGVSAEESCVSGRVETFFPYLGGVEGDHSFYCIWGLFFGVVFVVRFDDGDCACDDCDGVGDG